MVEMRDRWPRPVRMPDTEGKSGSPEGNGKPEQNETDKDVLAWQKVTEYIQQQAQGKEESWLPDFYELIDENGAPILDAEQKRVVVELGLLNVAGQSAPMVKTPVLPEPRRKGRGKRKERIEGSIIKSVSAFGTLFPEHKIAGVRKIGSMQLEGATFTPDPYAPRKEMKRVEASEVHKAQSKAIAFMLDSGNTIATIWSVLQTGNFGPKLSRGEIVRAIYDAKDVKGFVAVNPYFDLPSPVIKAVTDLAGRIQPEKKYGLTADELRLTSEAQKARRKSFKLDPGKYDSRWTDQVLLMAAHLSAAKIPHDLAAKIMNGKLEEVGRGPLTYSEMGQVYTRVFFRDPNRFIQEGNAVGEALSPDLQSYVEQSIREYNETKTAAREERIAETIVNAEGEIQYDVEALRNLSDENRELLLAWNQGESSTRDLSSRFNIRPDRLNLKIAALRAVGFPVREGTALKTFAERIKIDPSIDTTANPEVYEYDSERLSRLPEQVQWLVKVWNRGEFTQNQLANKTGVDAQNLQAYLFQLRQQQYPVRIGEGRTNPLAGASQGTGGGVGGRLAEGDDNLDESIRQLLQHPILPREEQRDLVRQWQENADNKARERLVRHYYRFIAKIAMRYRKYGVDMADLMSFGADGMLRAIDKFDLKKDFAVSTYAAWWIRQRIVRGIQNEGSLVRTPVYLQTGERSAEGRVAVTGFEDLAVRTREGGESELDTLPELMNDSMVAEQTAVEARQVTEGWKEVLNERELDIVTRRFFGDETLEEIGLDPKYGVTRERIRQIEEVGLDKLRAFLGVELREKRFRSVDREGTIDRFVDTGTENLDEKWKGILSARELQVLSQRFIQRKSREEVAQATGITVENIGIAESRGLRKVRGYFEFLDELTN